MSSGKPGEGRAESRRREILEAAERVFGRAGYWSATTAEIAAEVGLSQPALYRYFGSKRELFLAALGLRQQEIRERGAAALAGPGSAAQKLRQLARATVDLALVHPEMARLRVQAVAVASGDAEVAGVVRSTLSTLIAGHEALLAAAIDEGSIRADVDRTTAAHGIAALAFLLYVAISVEHPMAEPGTAQRTIDGFFRGLLGEQA